MRLTLKAVLISSIGLLSIAALGQGASNLVQLSSVRGGVDDIVKNWLPSVALASEMNTVLRDSRVKLYRLVVASNDAQTLGENIKGLNESWERMSRLQRNYEPLISSDEERQLYETFKTGLARYDGRARDVLELMKQSRKAEALELLTSSEMSSLNRMASQALDKDTALNQRGATVSGEGAMAIVSSAVLWAWICASVSLIVAAAAVLFSLFGVARPIERMTAAMRRLASGDAALDIPMRGRRDEIGDMAGAVQVFKENLIRTRALEEETAQARLAAEEQRKAGMRQMADGFEAAVGGIISMVSSSATELQATAQQMTSTASETAEQSTTVAAAAEQAAANVGTVAAAAEELGASVQEIGRQVDGSAELARVAVTEAGQTGTLVQELSGAVARIGDIVTMISSIASQTNLLALNATIEAARAGEAGRGFAVVASEVKELASQTARATEEISGQIGRIQGSTGHAVQAIDGIATRIRQISGVATTIAAAVEEQGAATQEIVRNVAQASTGTSEVTTNITGVARAAEDTGAAASQVLASASELSRQSEHLRAEVSRFLGTVRAA